MMDNDRYTYKEHEYILSKVTFSETGESEYMVMTPEFVYNPDKFTADCVKSERIRAERVCNSQDTDD